MICHLFSVVSHMSLGKTMPEADKATEIEERLIDFAVRVIKVADALPKTPVGKYIAGQ